MRKSRTDGVKLTSLLVGHLVWSTCDFIANIHLVLEAFVQKGIGFLFQVRLLHV